MKAISAIIATIMLLMISVSLIGVFYVFSSGMASSSTSSASEQASQITKQLTSCMKIDNIYNNQVLLSNCGKGVIENKSLVVMMDDVKLGASTNTIAEDSSGNMNITGLWQISPGKHNLKILNGATFAQALVDVQINKDGLVGSWNFDEGFGNKANDDSGNGNVGTLLPAGSEPTWVSGKFGNALQFDGSNDYVDAGNGMNTSSIIWLSGIWTSDSDWNGGTFTNTTATNGDLLLGTSSSLSTSYNPTSLSNTNYLVLYNANTALTGDITAYNITISPGVTVTTNGHNMHAWDSIDNEGTITTGSAGNGGGGGGNGGFAGGGGAYGLYLQSNSIRAGTINAGGGDGGSSGGGCGNGGAGGGGGGGVIILAYGSGGYVAGTYNMTGGSGGGVSVTCSASNRGGNGGTTLAPGGARSDTGKSGGNGASPAAPTVTNANIFLWYNGGFQNYFAGAGGGGGGGGSWGGDGSGGGSYPLSYGGSGGAGSGIMIPSASGGSGGGGTAISYQYSSQPIALATPYVYSSRGTYLSSTTTTALPIASITSAWNGTQPNANVNFTVEISANNGANWITASNNTQYAGGGGIGSGTQLKYRINFSTNDTTRTATVSDIRMNYSISYANSITVMLWKRNSTDSAWMHLVDSSGTLYMNGAVGSGQTIPVFHTGNVLIGKDSSGNFFNGSIDEVRVWSKALTPDETIAMKQII